jgi:hypothetical protein
MNVQQTINLEMLRAFAREGVSFAYPTRTVVVDTPIKIAQAAETEKRKGDRLTAADGARPTVPTLADALRPGASKTG